MFVLDMKKIAFLIVLTFSMTPLCAGQLWQSLGANASHTSISVDGPSMLDAQHVVWQNDSDPQNPQYTIEFEGPASIVAFKNKIFAYARYYDVYEAYTNSQIVAYDASSGEICWTALTEKSNSDSWSTPAIDAKNSCVVVGSGNMIYAFDANTGSTRWNTALPDLLRNIINASPVVAWDIPHARAFITDFSTGATGMLYCINLDAQDVNNPYQPGQIVWSALLGNTCGNTPAYADGVVYVACINDGDNSTGTIYAFDAMSSTSCQLWKSTDSRLKGFFGGLTITKSGFLYGATYYSSTSSGQNNSQLVKLRASDGRIEWITPCERTDSIPVVVGNNIYLSAGIGGTYGSRPKIQAFADNGSSAQMLWETPAGSPSMGGWSYHPVYANGKLYVGAQTRPITEFAGYSDLYVLDVTKTPQQSGFVISHFSGCGNSPAVFLDSLYAVGADGIYKFVEPKLLGDVSGDGCVDYVDINLFSQSWLFDGALGVYRSDVDLNGIVDFHDYSHIAGQFGMQ
ncbi:MAG: hypothetical protein A2Y07_02165 [Planctomycetes bacterium GWF2_50_10]|nr:MAG: hypothetical protein A2Y07_02165 [Planctomycetes bacterium GWF2_50_10]